MAGVISGWSLAILGAATGGEPSHSGPETPAWIQVLVPTLTSVIAILGTILVHQVASARKFRKQRAAQDAAFQLETLGPLQFAAQNLAWKLREIEEKIMAHRPGGGGLEWMLRTFHYAKEPQEILGRTPTPDEYAYWCNGEGFFAVSTIYALACFLLQAARARHEGPKHRELVGKLEQVRVALGHEFGIYVMLQDSIGEYVSDERGRPISYRRFCGLLLNADERPWLLNALDYFRDIDKKTTGQRCGIRRALRDLLAFLEAATRLPIQRAMLEDEPAPAQLSAAAD
jgi:hypothetical protein